MQGGDTTSQVGMQRGHEVTGEQVVRRTSQRRPCKEDIMSQESIQGGGCQVTGGHAVRKTCHRKACRLEDIKSQEGVQ